jgi:serine/threonine protein kinase
VDADVAALVKEERLLEAAELAASRGDARSASDIFERACAWKRASEEALRSGDGTRALTLALDAHDDDLALRALPLAVATAGSADALARRGDHAWAARVHEEAGRGLDAARSWERADDPLRAAELYEQASDASDAARVLEAGARRHPDRWALVVALGGLLLRYGKVEEGARALQRVPASAPERRRALAPLARALDLLSIREAAAEARAELASLGGEIEEPIVTAAAPVRTRLFGRYDVVREVASSPTARVLECTDTVRGERVAVKIFAAYDARGAGRDALARFEREVNVLAALDHPNVVPLRDYVADGPALVLVWMPGGTLEQMLAATAIAPARAVEIACAVLSALAEAHRLGVLHRDIKPANVLFDAAGVARLADFGAAHLGDLSATATAGVIGTRAYMSPEQREGRPATVGSDLFGIGVLLREMLTGERPSLDEAPRIRPSGAHRDLDARHDEVVLRFTDARYPDASSAMRALRELPWPSTVERVAPVAVAESAPSVRPPATRLEIALDGKTSDRLIGRPIDTYLLTPRSLARAAAFARASDATLQTVLRVDREGDAIWFEPPRGRPLDRPLAPSERAILGSALDALHACGVAHGCVCRDHVFVDVTGEVTLRFVADCDATSTTDLDRLGLARL